MSFIFQLFGDFWGFAFEKRGAVREGVVGDGGGGGGDGGEEGESGSKFGFSEENVN